MAIIINEFEVVAPPSAGQQPAREQLAAPAQPPAAPPRPEDIDLILRRMALRKLRLWAD